MTYANVITRLAAELRDSSSWPAAGSATTEQLNLLYNAGLAVASMIPLGRLSLVASAAIAGVAQGPSLKRYDLRAGGLNIFDTRFSAITKVADLGIAQLRLDGIDHDPRAGISVESIQAIANLAMHSGEKFYAVDYDNAQIYASGVTELKLWYAQKPAYPTAASDTWPLANDTDTERAIHIVAAHVNGVTIRDSAAAQMQALLQKTYNR